MRVNAAKSGAARQFWLYNRRFDGKPSGAMLGFKTGTTPKNKTKNKTKNYGQEQEKIMSMESASLKMFAAALQSIMKRPEKRGD